MLILLMLFRLEGYTQPSAYTFTSDGQLIFTNVIEKENQSQDELYTFAVKSFSNKKKYTLKKDDQEKTLSLSESFTLNEKGILSDIPFVEIHFQVSLEFKEGRYRYQLKDFVYLPYERNRYGKFETVQRKRKSLEDMMLTDQEWTKYDESFANHIQAEIKNLTQTMSDDIGHYKEDTARNIIQLNKEW